MRFQPNYSLLALGFIASLAATTQSAEPKKIAVEKLLTGLQNPTAVAVRPPVAGEPAEVFVAENGAGRVIKLSGDDSKKAIDVIAGFPIPGKTTNAIRTNGVQSLYFLDQMRLVAVGGNDDDTPFVRLYEVPDSDSPVTADHAKQDIDPPTNDSTPAFDANTFFCIARTQPNDRVGDNLLLATWRGDEPAGLVYVPVRAGTLSETMHARLKGPKQDVDAGPITVSSSGYVVVANREKGDSDAPTYLAFFSPLDRRAVLKVTVNLRNISALAYSPKTGNLYAANYQSSANTPAGVYRIDAANEEDARTCNTVKIAEVSRPTSLSFTADGTLYVTALGEENQSNAGVLLKVTGDL
jgi:hypothetical protein